MCWSPDGRSLGYFATGELKRIDVAGGAPRTLCAVPTNRGGTWGPDNTIIFSTDNGGLQRVSASGGTPTALTSLGEGETGHWRPVFLPDGRHFAYGALTGGGPRGPVYVASSAFLATGVDLRIS